MAVTRLEINSREPFNGGQSFGPTGAYEQLGGTAHFAVDPSLPGNDLIDDIDLAPGNADGLVNFSADFRIIRPANPGNGNHRLFLDVVNRGNNLVFKYINGAAETQAFNSQPDPGTGFLMRQGYTLVWCGWQHDVPDSPGLLRVHVPEGLESGEAISGKLAVTFQPNAPSQVQQVAEREHRPYPANNLEDWNSTLIVQEHEDAPKQVIPRDQWAFGQLEDGRVIPSATQVCMSAGFEPGKIYQVTYSTTGAPIAGLGLLGTRDLVSFLRYGGGPEGNPCVDDIEYAYAFGASQSGRFLRTLLYLGLNQDEEDREVFDGIIAHIAGARRGEFNQRFAQPSTAIRSSKSNLFPFADVPQVDPNTGRSDGLLSRLAARDKLPKLFLTNSGAEYWWAHASLVHIDASGTEDLTLSDSVRLYYFAGTQHASGTFPVADTDASGTRGQQYFNCVDYRPLLRAAVTNLDRWVSQGESPPDSQYPKLSDGSAVPPQQLAPLFQAIPGVEFPAHLRQLAHLEFSVDGEPAENLPSSTGPAYPIFVPTVDTDGNEIAGILLPDLTVPLATHTGWNLRHRSVGGPGQIIGTTGGTIPFPAARLDREATGDPRLSVEERYASRGEYLEKVRIAARTLVDGGFLLAEDLDELLAQASQRFDVFSAPVKETQAADN